MNETSVHMRLSNIRVSKHSFQTNRTNDLAGPSLSSPAVAVSVVVGALDHLAQLMISLLPSAFHVFYHSFRLGGGVSQSGAGSRFRSRKDFLGSSGGAPSSGELDSVHEEHKPKATERGMDAIPYPSIESPYTSEEPTALMTSSVR